MMAGYFFFRLGVAGAGLKSCIDLPYARAPANINTAVQPATLSTNDAALSAREQFMLGRSDHVFI